MNHPLRVLLVEDNPGDADLILELLPTDGPEEYCVSCVVRLTEALERVDADRFDVILLDLGLPDSSGLDTLRAMRRQVTDLPIVLLTGDSDEQTGFAAVREGAQDYLLKGQIDNNLLIRSIKYAIDRKVAENSLKRLNDTLEERIDERTAQLTTANEMLRIEIDERKQVEERLQSSLHLKEVLLKEIHHRVKNNLQVISSLVNLQADTIDNPDVRGLFRDVRDRVRSMALVHEKLYQSEDLACVPFDAYVESLLNYLRHAYGHAEAAIRFTMNLQPVLLSVELAVPCGLIVNELITNALKHAFPGRDRGEIVTDLYSSPDGTVSLRVRDDGIGLPPELDWGRLRSLGLRLVQMLIGQLNATLEFNGADGTEFQITFKLPKTAKEEEQVHG